MRASYFIVVRRRNVGVMIALISTIAGALPAQSRSPVVTIPSTCAPCITRASREYTIDGRVTPIEGRPSGVTQDRRGRLIVWYTRQPLFVFDSSGRLVTRVGKVGVGPGEITPVRWVVAGRDDTVRVHATGRINVFAGRDFHYVRSTIWRSPEPAPRDILPLPSGITASRSGISSERGDLNPIFLRDRNGQLIRQLSPTKWEYRPDRVLAAAATTWEAPLWLAESRFLKSEGYSVMLVDTLGVVRRTFERNPDWWQSQQTVLPPRMLTSMSDTVRRPSANVESLREDNRGRLHVLVRMPRPDWAAVRADEQYQEGNYLAMLEVIEPRTRRLVASIRIVGAPIAVVGDNRLVTYREDREGYPHIDVWRIGLP